GQQTIDGGPGDDVLKGGTGADIFVISNGNGSDLIRDFGSDDTVRLDVHGLSSFDEVRASMTQSGSDVQLDLGGGEVLVFANTTIDDLDASQFMLSLDRSSLTLSFSDDFNTLDLRNGDTGTWDSNFWWGAANGGTLTQNGELQWYIDPTHGPTSS